MRKNLILPSPLFLTLIVVGLFNSSVALSRRVHLHRHQEQRLSRVSKTEKNLLKKRKLHRSRHKIRVDTKTAKQNLEEAITILKKKVEENADPPPDWPNEWNDNDFEDALITIVLEIN